MWHKLWLSIKMIQLNLVTNQIIWKSWRILLFISGKWMSVPTLMASRLEGVCYRVCSVFGKSVLAHTGSPHWMWTKYLSVCSSRVKWLTLLEALENIWFRWVDSTHKKAQKTHWTRTKKYYYFPNCFDSKMRSRIVNNLFFCQLCSAVEIRIINFTIQV